ncbi:MAG TPA: anti-sigma factor [Casimicrobiaceae bacterium]|nr:anti-sigma factor [Casimicrobiaceae bacterium]
MTRPVDMTEADLAAFVDGQLPPDRAAQVEAAIAQDSAAAARVAQLRSQNAALVNAFDATLDEPIPTRLVAAAAPPLAAPRASRWGIAASLVATLVLGIALGWLGRDAMLASRGTPTTFAREAAFSHAIYAASDNGRPVEISATEEARLVRWLNRRLNVEVTPPDLTGIGFSLVGGRLVAGNERPTGLFMYENAGKERLTLQWRKNATRRGEEAFRYAHENGIGVFYWISENCAYALSGNVDRSRLLAVAQTIHTQLAPAYPQQR